MNELPVVPFATQAEWHTWLEEHPDADGVLLKLAKKGSGIPSITYAEAVEVALCHGWIDGQMRRLDEQYHLQNSRRAGRAATGRNSTGRRRRR